MRHRYVVLPHFLARMTDLESSQHEIDEENAGIRKKKKVGFVPWSLGIILGITIVGNKVCLFYRYSWLSQLSLEENFDNSP